MSDPYVPVRVSARVDGDTYGKPGIVFRSAEVLGAEADLAVRLLEHWGLVASESDGEDSAGRHRIRRASPEEVVARALDTATLLYSEARKRGLLVSVPEVPTHAEWKAAQRAEEEREAAEIRERRKAAETAKTGL